MLYNEWSTIEENNQSDKSIKQEKAVEACNRKTSSLAIRLAPACKKRDVLHRCAGGAHHLVNRAARSSTSGLLARPWLTWGTEWERTGDEMGVVSCCVGVAAERTEAPGRVPEGVKPRTVDRWMQRVIR